MFLYNTVSLSCTSSLPGGACGAAGSAPPMEITWVPGPFAVQTYVGIPRQGQELLFCQPHSLCLERHLCSGPVLSVSTTDALQPGGADTWGQVHSIISYVTRYCYAKYPSLDQLQIPPDSVVIARGVLPAAVPKEAFLR